INQGEIRTPAGGSVYLIGNNVSNEGIITTPKGETILAAGATVSLIDSATPGVKVDITGAEGDATNLGQITAEAGRIGIAGVIVRNSGQLNASSVVREGGRIFLRATKTLSLDASSQIRADAGQAGNGGSISVKAGDTAAIDGAISSKGGRQAGYGGFIETSASLVRVADSARVTTLAPAGQSGLWLIDPTDYTIAAIDPGDGSSYMSNSTLSTNLGGGPILIQTLATGAGNGDIFVNDAVTWNVNKLTLAAHRNININADLNGSGTAQLALDYGQGALAAGNSSGYKLATGAKVSLPAGLNFSARLGSDGSPVNFTVITSLGAQGSTTSTDLQGMSGTLSGVYALGADIDASATSGWNSGAGFAPVGNFTGILEGFGHTVTGLTIKRSTTDYVGLFAQTGTGSILRNLGLLNVNIIGRYAVGGLAGSNWSAISNAYTTGTVSSTDYGVGGLAGRNYKTIANSYSTANVTGSNVGGLVGIQGSTVDVGSTTSSYATGTVTGTGNYTGGLVGYNYATSTISNSYSTGAVGGGVNYLGGLVGGTDGPISSSYSTGSVTGSSFAGGLVGYAGAGTVTNSYWDTETSGKATSAGGGTGKTSAEMRQQATFSGFDFTNNWWLSESNTRPFLRSEYSTTINNAHQLQLMAINLGANYTLSGNIDLGPALAAVNGKYAGMWGSSGFVPVGSNATKFTGTLDGLNHTISNLVINRSASDYVGLFGYTDSGSAVRNVGLEGGSVAGHNFVGALAGLNNGAVSNTYNTGAVSGTQSVGGLVGNNNYYGTIVKSYNSGSVTGNGSSYYIGGLAGEIYYGDITNSYSTGSVSGYSYVGGLGGANSQGDVTNSFSSGSVTASGTDVGGLIGYTGGGGVYTSYWDTETSGRGSSAGGTGKTSAELLTQTTYGWDFTNTWWMANGNTRPFLRSEYSTTINNAHQLQLMATNLGASYTLAGDIDLGQALAAVNGKYPGMWSATGFMPIGNSSTNFTGIFDGLRHTLTGLYINLALAEPTGLFGKIGSGGIVRDVGLVGGSVSGSTWASNAAVGALAGENHGTISNSYAGADVHGARSFVGGLVGYNVGSITASFATGNVTLGESRSGGLVGQNNGSISNSYATGSVTGGCCALGGLAGHVAGGGSISNSYSTGFVAPANTWWLIGGLLGESSSGGNSVTNSYWDMDTSGRSSSLAGTGLSTAQMMQPASLTGFDFTNVWNIVPGITYPYLKWQFAETPQVVSGLATGTAAGKTIQAVTNGIDLAKTFTGANGFYYFALPGNSVPNGNTLVTFVAGDAYKGAAAYGSAGGHAIGMAIAQNTLTVAGGGVSNSSLGTAKGALASTDIPYSVSGSNLSLSSGFAFQTLSGASYTLDGNVTTVDAAQTWGGTAAMTSNAILAAGTGAIAINGAISGAGRNLTLNTGGNVSQSAAISVAGLELLGTGGNYQLTHGGNAVTTLAGNTGTVNFSESNGFDVDTVNSTDGVTATGNITLLGTGPVSVAKNLSSTAGGNILLAAQGVNSAAYLEINASVTASGGTGGIDLYAGYCVQISGTGVNVSTASTGVINIYAGRDYNNGAVRAGQSSGYIWQLSPSTVRSDDGNINLYAPSRIKVDEIHSNADGNAQWGDVLVQAGDNTFGVGTIYGSIDNISGTAARPHIKAGKLTLRATADIGWMGNGPNFVSIDASELDLNTSGNHAALLDENDTRGDGLTISSAVITGKAGTEDSQGLFLQQGTAGGIKLGFIDVFGRVRFTTSGAITDTNGTAMNIISRDANTITGGVVLQGGTGVGTLADPIEIQTPKLAGTISNTGVFSVANTGALEIGSVLIYTTTPTDGITMITGSATPGDDIVVTTDGTLTLTQPVTNKLAGAITLGATESIIQSGGAISTAGTTYLTAAAGTGDILLNNTTNSLRDVTVVSGRDVSVVSTYNGAATIVLPLAAGGLRDVAIAYPNSPSVTLGSSGNGYWTNNPIELSGNLAVTS
ncbi:MAG: GLUG motif-containing protein, partial [Sulfuritalea sp.]|nr:GLUG motif-containing protein [Sulfuritalea sp.]